MAEMKEAKGGFARHAESEAKKDVMPMSERVGSIVGVVGGLIVLLFFVLHQTWATGFFTEKFGATEAFLFFGSIALAELTTVARTVVGRKNVVRPLEAFSMAFAAVAAVWLYMAFPFDFSHLADVLPDFLRFVLAWISDGIARVVMVLTIFGASFFAAYTVALYVYVQRLLLAAKESSA